MKWAEHQEALREVPVVLGDRAIPAGIRCRIIASVRDVRTTLGTKESLMGGGSTSVPVVASRTKWRL